jgi:flagellar biogenesis protein FliO
MRRFHFLPIASAALLVAATCSRSAAQSSTAYSPSTSISRRAPAPAQIRAVAPTSEQTSVSTPDRPLGSKHKSWKDLARSKSDGKTDKPSATFSPWSAAGALAVVVALILLLARLFRRHAPMFSQSLPQEALEILGRRFVDPRQAILLVRIGARILVVGSSANGLNPLGQIDDPIEVDLLAGLCRRGPQAGVLGTSFFKLLKGEARARPAPSAVRSSPSARQAAPRGPIADPPSVSEPLERPEEGLSQPEYDLMRRLRGASVPVHADRMDGVR